MNSLSWFLYLAETVGKLGAIAEAFSIILGLGFVVIAFWHFTYLEDRQNTPKPPVRGYTLTFVIMVLVAIVTPSKETIYLIAGSEAGEAIVTSESGQEILNDIHEVIKHQLGQLKEEKKQ